MTEVMATMGVITSWGVECWAEEWLELLRISKEDVRETLKQLIYSKSLKIRPPESSCCCWSVWTIYGRLWRASGSGTGHQSTEKAEICCFERGRKLVKFYLLTEISVKDPNTTYAKSKQFLTSWNPSLWSFEFQSRNPTFSRAFVKMPDTLTRKWALFAPMFLYRLTGFLSVACGLFVSCGQGMCSQLYISCLHNKIWECTVPASFFSHPRLIFGSYLYSRFPTIVNDHNHISNYSRKVSKSFKNSQDAIHKDWKKIQWWNTRATSCRFWLDNLALVVIFGDLPLSRGGHQTKESTVDSMLPTARNYYQQTKSPTNQESNKPTNRQTNKMREILCQGDCYMHGRLRSSMVVWWSMYFR